MKLAGSNGLTTNSSGMLTSEWRKPFNISIGLHILVLACAMLAPNLFDGQPQLPEVYTVNLFTATEVAEPAPSAPQPAAPETTTKPAPRQIEPEMKKPVISVQPAEPEVPSPIKTTIAKPISLKPRKLKVKVGKTRQEEAREKAKLSQVRQRLKTDAAQKAAQAEADDAAKDAVSKLADALHTTTPATTGTVAQASDQTVSATNNSGVSGPRRTGLEPGFYEKMYYAAVHQKIQNHWILPDLQNWDTSLEARVVIKIRKDGMVTDSFFEKKSANIYFNQFVLKAVKEASPLPPIPGQLKEDPLEIGLVFKPGELY